VSVTRGARVAGATLVVLALGTGAAWAGPPLITDDPVPTAWKHWEIVVPFTLESTPSFRVVQVPGLDVNYGGGKNLQLTLGTGVEWRQPLRDDSRFRLADLELAVKLRFLTQGRADHQSQLAVFPRWIVPNANHWGSVGVRTTEYELPLVWLRELDARTRLYGDLHLTVIPEADRDPAFAGIAFEREVNARWTLTGELYGESSETAGGDGVSGFQLGFFRALRRTNDDEEAGTDLLFAAGRTFSRDRTVTLYVGPRFTFRGLAR
jgi:hypothetical protein